MSALSVHEHTVRGTAPPACDGAADALLRQLVDRIERVGDPEHVKLLRRTSEHVEEVLLELEVDGTSYLVVRSRPQSSARAGLSPRELAIARLIAQGLPNKTIGAILDISPWTVATHIRRIFTKLDVTSRAAMVARLSDEA